MRIAFLSSCSPQQLYLIRKVLTCWPDASVLRPVWSFKPKPGSRWRRWLSAPWTTVSRRIKDWLRRTRGQRIDALVHRLLFADLERRLPAGCIDVPASGLNEATGVEAVSRLAPDLLIVAGAPLLHERIFSIARLATVNVHYGIAPAYRGEDTIFWPLYFQDFDHIGVTLHQIDHGVDTGPILALGRPKLEPDDTEVTLEAKCAEMAAELLLGFLSHVQATGRIGGCQQVSPGRLFRTRDRTLCHDVGWALRRSLWGVRVPHRPATILTYY